MTRVSFRSVSVIGVVAAALAVPAWAQTSTKTNAPADEMARTSRSQFHTFESALRTAVETGTRDFAQGASEMLPQIFAVMDSPVVAGVPVALDGQGTQYYFHIQIPTVWPLVQVMTTMRRPSSVAPSRPVSDGRVQTVGGLVQADPIDPPAVNASNRADLERNYAMKIRDQLKDTMLDNAAVLPMAAGDVLIVIASGSDVGGDDVPRNLVLSLKGADLIALRQNSISRSEAKTRIGEVHF